MNLKKNPSLGGCSKYLYNKSPCSVNTWFNPIMIFIGIKVTMILANSTMKNKNSVSIVFLENSWTFVKLLPSFCFNCCKVNNACLNRSVLHCHKFGTCLVWIKSPITFVVIVNFLWGQLVCMIFVRKSIPLSTSIFVSTIFNHSTAELFISYESNMDSLETSLLALFFSWLTMQYSMSPGFLPYRCPWGRPFFYDVVRNGKEVHRVLDKFLVLLRSVSQEVSARALDNANVPEW